MRDAAHITDDLFAVRVADDQYYLYAPLRPAVALVNGAMVAAVAKAMSDPDGTSVPLIRELQTRGLLSRSAPAPPLFPAGYEFCPHEVTLFPTSRCNLRCRYCYADAGRKSVDMRWEVARSAIDLVSTNAGLLGSRSFSVGFHGGGEPTVAWDMIVRCVEHARGQADAMGLEAQIFTATNGLLSQAQREYMARYFNSVTVSLDGPRDIQDYNRPRLDGSGSYDEIRATLQHFDQAGLFYSIRSTITAGTVSRMEEIVHHLKENWAVSDLHMEPAWRCGRCMSSGEVPPSDQEFIENFCKARAAGRRLGVDVHYSGARLDVLTSRFCAAPGDGFSVLPEGVATSCYEITESRDPRAEIFHYGRYDPGNDAFRFDREKLAALRKLSVEYLNFCGDCFCKWHCAGDCLAKVFARSGRATHEGSQRCGLNRELTLRQLAELVQSVGAEGGARPPAQGAGPRVPGDAPRGAP